MLILSGHETNDHLKILNGKVADHERRLSDYGAFKDSVRASVEISAKKKAAFWSVLLSITIPLIVSLILYFVFHIKN